MTRPSCSKKKITASRPNKSSPSFAVEAYLDRVTEKPSDKRLEGLFNAYKDVLPAPDREEPAFKEPHRVELEWITANPNVPTMTNTASITPSLIKLFTPFQPTAYDLK